MLMNRLTVVNDLYSVLLDTAQETAWRQLRDVPWMSEEAREAGHRLPSLITG